MKSLRLQLPVIAESDADELLDLVTAVEGVVGALVDVSTATLEVLLSRATSALLVREQLSHALAGSRSALPGA